MRPPEGPNPDPYATASQTADAPPAATADPDWLRVGGEPLPGYRLVRPLGAGGFGQVWRADAPGQIPVALKFVSLSAGGRVERSALDLIKHIRHPNLLVLFGAWERDEWLIIGMEFVIDGSLADRLVRARSAGLAGIPRADLRRYMTDAADVIDFLNKPRHFLNGSGPVALQHGDVKPQNLLRHGRHLKLADFGLVRVLGPGGEGGGLTPAYAAPEVFAGRPTRWSDQYALAVAYCELRGGRRPPRAEAAADDPDLSMLPAAERPVVGRALARNPRDRWPSCRRFVRELARAYAQSPAEPTARFLDRVRGDPPPFQPPADSTDMPYAEPGADADPTLTLADEPPSETGSIARPSDRHPLKAGAPARGARRPVTDVALVGLLVVGVVLAAAGSNWWVVGLVPVLAWAGRWLRGAIARRGERPRRADVGGGANARERETPRCSAPTRTVHPTPPAPSAEFSAATWLDELSLLKRPDRPPDASSINFATGPPDDTPPPEPAGLAADGFQSLGAHADSVWGVALSADGGRAVSGGMDGGVRLWDVPGGREERRLSESGPGVTAVCLSADGRVAAAAALDGTIRVWDGRTGDPVCQVTTDGDRPVAVALSADGADMYSSGADGTVTRWSVSAGRPVGRTGGPGGPVYALAVSPDGCRVAAGTAAGHTWVFDRDPEAVSLHVPPAGPVPAAIRCLAFARDGRRVAAGREDGVVLVIDAGDPPAAVILHGHSDWVRGVAFLPDGGRVMSVGDDETVQVYEPLPAGRWRRAATHRSADESLLACAASGGVVVVGGESGTVYVRTAGLAPDRPEEGADVRG